MKETKNTLFHARSANEPKIGYTYMTTFAALLLTLIVLMQDDRFKPDAGANKIPNAF